MFRRSNHRRKVVLDFLLSRACQQGNDGGRRNGMTTGTILMFPQELPDFLGSGVTHIVDGIVMLALKEIHLEGQYGEQARRRRA